MNLGGNVVNLLEFFSKIGLREKDRTDIGGVPETGYLLSDPLRVNNDPSFNDSASVNNVGSFKPSMSTLETFKYDAPEFENLSESSVNYIKNYILY
ncbi:MAG: hypothetical protein NT030_07925 [Candidatus Saganbacteria bacterium]|nr:hypothetical protein [Candidatus Saganbacteria bacterium]